ncbi:hypothetical protein ACLKA6_001214 [Drosophila palustris]
MNRLPSAICGTDRQIDDENDDENDEDDVDPMLTPPAVTLPFGRLNGTRCMPPPGTQWPASTTSTTGTTSTSGTTGTTNTTTSSSSSTACLRNLSSCAMSCETDLRQQQPQQLQLLGLRQEVVDLLHRFAHSSRDQFNRSTHSSIVATVAGLDSGSGSGQPAAAAASAASAATTVHLKRGPGGGFRWWLAALFCPVPVAPQSCAIFRQAYSPKAPQQLLQQQQQPQQQQQQVASCSSRQQSAAIAQRLPRGSCLDTKFPRPCPLPSTLPASGTLRKRKSN